jgi:hypothetical protein
MVSGMIFPVSREFAGKISKIWSSPHFGWPAQRQLSTCLIRKFPKPRNRELTRHIRKFRTRPALPKRNEKAIFKLAEAFEARRLVIENPTLSLAAIAKARGRCHKHLAKLIERSFVAPEDLVAIFAVK